MESNASRGDDGLEGGYGAVAEANAYASEELTEPAMASPLEPTQAVSSRLSAQVGLFVAGICSLFVFALLNWPDIDGLGDLAEPLLFLDTTPSGGDMGAHVWGPAYLRDNLIPQGRLTGWTPDWYSGFPAYHFYMVVPSLAIIALNVGLPWFIALPLLAVGVGAIFWFRGQNTANDALAGLSILNGARSINPAIAVPVAIGVLALVMAIPYGVAFKLVSVAGLVAFPWAAWMMGRLARSPEPIPTFLALGAFIFLFDTNFTIYGGNITSTLAGEFAFSISLCLTLLAIGVALRGMDDNVWLARGAVIIALVALCHLIPVFFVVPALMLGVLSNGTSTARSWLAAGTISLSLIPIAFADGNGNAIKALAIGAVIVVFGAAMVGDRIIAARSRWLFIAGPVAVLIAAFWLMPFYLREPYFNDMGWERLNEVGAPMLTVPMKIALPVAAIGLLLAYASQERIGMIFSGTGLGFAAAVANLGEGPLWNARLLPFYYLSVYLVAAVGIALVVRFVGAMLSGDLERPRNNALVAASVAGLLAALIAVAMPLRLMPFGQLTEDGQYRWLAFTNSARSAVPSWANWNYSGYERKDSYREYHNVVTAMGDIGDSNGCGRAMWEYSKELDRYGTPMALMLLPHWTEGCIGSMEGLYFESSATTPFHFLNQSVLSDAPSRAQRDLPYKGFDIEVGVAQLQTMGVRYYMAQSDVAIAAARADESLTELGEAQPFVIFEVAASELVEGLSFEPVVVSGRSEEQVSNDEAATKFDVGWVGQAVEFYNNPQAYLALPAEDGPEGWQRQESLVVTDGRAIDPVTIYDLDVDSSSISFDVSEPGRPVYVKASYFPNWEAKGADGPWRAGPNLMVVVPTETSVELNYGRTGIDWLANLLTLVGLGLLVVLARLRPKLAFAREHGVGAGERAYSNEAVVQSDEVAHNAPRSGYVDVEPEGDGPIDVVDVGGSTLVDAPQDDNPEADMSADAEDGSASEPSERPVVR